MLLAKIKDVLFNRRNKYEIESLDGDIDGLDIKDLVDWVSTMKELFNYDDETHKLQFNPDAIFSGDIFFNGDVYIPNLQAVVNEDGDSHFPSGKVPNLWTTEDDFNDLSTDFLEQLQTGDIIYSDSNGLIAQVIYVDESYVGITYYDNNAIYSCSYSKEDDEWSCVTIETPITILGLTHSINELDSTLKQIVQSAITDNFHNGVACSQEQWNGIKDLLDKSLYIYYDGYLLIKVISDGIQNYVFGNSGSHIGSTLELVFDDSDNKLYIGYNVL